MNFEDFSSKMINDSQVVRISWSTPRGLFIIEPVLANIDEILEFKVTYYSYHDEQATSIHLQHLEEKMMSKTINNDLSKLNVPIGDYDYANNIIQFVKEALLNDYLYYKVRARCLSQQNPSVTFFFENEMIFHPGIPKDFLNQIQQGGMRDILVTLKDLNRYVYGLSPRTIREDKVHEIIPQVKEYLNTYLIAKTPKNTNPYEIKEILSRYRKTFTLIEIGFWALELERSLVKNFNHLQIENS